MSWWVGGLHGGRGGLLTLLLQCKLGALITCQQSAHSMRPASGMEAEEAVQVAVHCPGSLPYLAPLVPFDHMKLGSGETVQGSVSRPLGYSSISSTWKVPFHAFLLCRAVLAFIA